MNCPRCGGSMAQRRRGRLPRQECPRGAARLQVLPWGRMPRLGGDAALRNAAEAGGALWRKDRERLPGKCPGVE
jgi:hypothetical protein